MNAHYKIDLHMHTTVSDGTDTPEEIISRVRDAGISLFSVTDHDAVKGCRRVIAARTEDDPRFIAGVEFSCRDGEGKYHILGYGYDPDSPAINDLVDTGHRYRMSKFTARLDFLRDKFGFVFPDEEIEQLFARDNPGKPHLGNLMVKYGYAGSKEEAIHDFIDKVKFKSFSFTPGEVIEGILASGGIPVLAHPTYGSGDQLIIGKDMEHRIKRLKGYGIKGLEAFYSGFSEKICREVLAFADEFDLYVTAGSDYHGTNKLIVPGDNGLSDEEELPGRLIRFVEDVTVIG